MRSLLAIGSALVFSLSVIACSNDSDTTPEPLPHSDPQHVESQLVGEGGACTASNDCEEGLTCEAVAESAIGTRGLAAPTQSSSSSSSGSTPSPAPAPAPTTTVTRVCVR